LLPEPLFEPLPEPEFLEHPAWQEFSATLQLAWADLSRAEHDFWQMTSEGPGWHWAMQLSKALAACFWHWLALALQLSEHWSARSSAPWKQKMATRVRQKASLCICVLQRPVWRCSRRSTAGVSAAETNVESVTLWNGEQVPVPTAKRKAEKNRVRKTHFFYRGIKGRAAITKNVIGRVGAAG
jgi:hypothetical protein